MPINITMPALSPTMEEGNLARWLVKEGDKVEPGDVIAEIETDKATMEVEAVDEGTMAKIVVPDGTESVKVNELIAVLAEEGEDVEAAASGADAAKKEVASQTVTSDVASAVDIDPAATGATTKESTDKGAAHGRAPADNENTREITDDTSGTGGADSSSASGQVNGSRAFASPLARRLAKDAGIELSAIQGSGPRGRIVKADVEKAKAEGGSEPSQAAKQGDAPKAEATPPTGAPTTGNAVKGMSDAAVLKLYDEADYTKKPHDGMRKVIAERLTESSQTIPSYTIAVDVSLDELLKLRSQVNAGAPKNDEGKPAFKLSVNDFIVKAMAIALQRVPAANASWTSTDRILHKHSDVGVAVAIPDGLFTPIVRRAEEKSLSMISAEVKDMAKRARDKKLAPQEYQGGSTAVSNLGMFGVSAFTSIINPPHASIVSIGAGVEKPVVKDGALAIGTVMTATFAFDHRVIDGALGAELASAFREAIEAPMSLLV